MNTNAKTIKTVIVVAIMCALVLGYYTYLSNKNGKRAENVKLTEKEELLDYNLEDEHYPHLPTDVVRLYSRMITCLYNDKLSDEDLEQMVAQMRKMYADSFANDPNNTKEKQIEALKSEISSYGDKIHKITNTSIAELSQTEYGEVSGEATALVDVSYTIRDQNDYIKQPLTYVFVQDKNKKWKILGWQLNADSDTSENGAGKE